MPSKRKNDKGEKKKDEKDEDKDTVDDTDCDECDSPKKKSRKCRIVINNNPVSPVDDDEEDIDEYYNELLRQIQAEPKEFVTITKSVNTIADLIEIGKMYDPVRDYNKEYNIDVRALHRLVEPLTELQNMIGMKCIKEDIVDHILFTIQKFDEHHETMMHTVIEGPPGTGKTEVAKIIGRIYLAMGILRNNKFVKATRSDLIAGYLGQTSIATQRIINSASGGVLFIDEVYSLGNAEKRDSFSKECIDTINENLTAKKNDFICIIAGYKEDIKQCFFAYNAGLERRFPIRFRIEEYNASELFSIFQKKVKDNNWLIDETTITLEFFKKNHDQFTFFGGDMELLFNSCKRCHSRRVFTTGDTKKLLRISDLDKGFASFTNHRQKKDKKDDETGLWRTMYM
jgi:replication-associated recombination protein RarA